LAGESSADDITFLQVMSTDLFNENVLRNVRPVFVKNITAELVFFNLPDDTKPSAF